METSETLKLMAVLKAAYPGFYSNISKQEGEAAVGLWQTMLSTYDYETVSVAARVLICTKKFPPSVAEVIEKIKAMKAPGQLSEMEAWHKVVRAASNGYYGAKEEFDNLPPIIRRIVGSPNMLRQWAMMDLNEFQTVVQSNFMRSYRALAQKESEYLSLPEDVKKDMERLTGSFDIRKSPSAIDVRLRSQD